MKGTNMFKVLAASFYVWNILLWNSALIIHYRKGFKNPRVEKAYNYFFISTGLIVSTALSLHSCMWLLSLVVSGLLLFVWGKLCWKWVMITFITMAIGIITGGFDAR